MPYRQFFRFVLTVIVVVGAVASAAEDQDARIDALIDQLIGFYQADAPGTGNKIYHKVVEVAAPRLGPRVVYHQIGRDDFDGPKPMIQKFYVFQNTNRGGKNLITKALSVQNNSLPANVETMPAVLATLEASSLQNFPSGCELVWRPQSDGSWTAAPAAGRCRYVSETLKRVIVAELAYRLNAETFAMHDVLRGVDGKPLFPDTGVSLATRTRAQTAAQFIGLSRPNEWRLIDPANLLQMELTPGRYVYIELAKPIAPRAVANILTLARQGFYDGLHINRVQDNFVAQWGGAEGQRPLGAASRTLSPEFERAWTADLAVTALPDRDGFAPQVGFVAGMPAGLDRARDMLWGAHCYATVGVGRDNDVTSGNGTELYAVIGHAPRQLDRNITVVGRVVRGIEHLSALPRGSNAMGFYDSATPGTAIKTVRVVADLPGADQPMLTAMRTDSASFATVVEARRNRRDDWYKTPAGYIDLCNVPLPVR